jgi:alpha-galactosidase
MIHHLRSSRVSLVIDTSSGVPAIRHWGEPVSANEIPVALFDEPVAEGGLDMRAALSLFPENGSGYMGRPGLGGRRADGRGWAPRFTTASTAVDADHTTLVHESTDTAAGLSLTSTIDLTPSGVVRIQTIITNTGDTRYELDHAWLTLPLPPEARELLTWEGRWTNEFSVTRRPWPSGTQSVENWRGRTSHDRVPFIVAGTSGFTETTGSVWGLHVGWSGNSAIYADANDARRSLSSGELLLPGEIVLEPGASYTTPWLYGSFSSNGLGDMSRAFHQYLRERTNHPKTPRPIVLNTWEAVYFQHDLATLSALADRAATVGVERFVLDDGWFGGRRNDKAGLGDWWVSPEVWPQGLAPLISHVRSLGMEFGIWVEPEMVNPDSDLYRAHPDWVLTDPAYTAITGRHQLVLNLGLKDVRTYLFNHLDSLLRDHDIAYVKWDMNRDLSHASTDGRASINAQTRGVYELFARLNAAHPNVEFESCASGGGRIDFGILDYTKRFWTSDSNDAHDRQMIQRGFSMLFPPELMGAHVGPATSHTTMRTLTLSMRAITAFFGHLGTEWNLLKVSDEDLDQLHTWFARHKKFRSLLHHGDVHRIEVPHGCAIAHGVVAPDRTEALYAYIQLHAATTLLPDRLRLVGLDPDRTYRVEIEAKPEKRFGPAKRQPDWTTNGITARGDVLSTIGLHPPTLDPDAAILVHATAL